MIVSIDWLREFVKINETPQELAEVLSKIGLEAEIKNNFCNTKNVVIGFVKDVKNHPNADKLKICTIDDGSKLLQVVCGAPNVSSGQKIAFAKVGAILPGGLKIKKAKIRGIESFGMICSESELNISENHDGIMVLPKDVRLGENFILGYGKKFISLELDVTPNRPDALSHQGVSRDIACFTKRKFLPLTYKKPNCKNKKIIDIVIENKKDCSTYVGGILEGVKVGVSPQWLIERLKSVGQKSINNIVDISNYVLLEIGHPTHIFDYDKIFGKKIKIRRANKVEKLTTLDEKKRSLNKENLIIADEKGPIALAGIMGGLNTSVINSTKTIFIESAYFDPVTIRKSSKISQLTTDASKRFERGTDPLICLNAFQNKRFFHHRLSLLPKQHHHLVLHCQIQKFLLDLYEITLR